MDVKGGWAVKLLLFVMAVTLGMATVRIATINARGGYQTFEAVVRAITSFASMLMCLALIVWGFAALAWYWPVATFVAASIIVGMAIGRDNWPAFYRHTAAHCPRHNRHRPGPLDCLLAILTRAEINNARAILMMTSG